MMVNGVPDRHSNRTEWRIGKYGYGYIHRIDGPAIEYDDGRMEWRIEGWHLDEIVRGDAAKRSPPTTIEDIPDSLWEAIVERDRPYLAKIIDGAPKHLREKYGHLAGLVECGVL